MVSEGYDHLVAIVVVSMIFIGTVVALPAINYSNMQTIDQQQLRNTALNVFDSMLLDVGSRSTWGTVAPGATFDPTTVKKFGLAYADPFSKFVLDIDKVQRINDTNPTGFIKYDDIRTLLGIEDYGFHFTLFRPFRVDGVDGLPLTIDKQNNLVHFNVIVTRIEDGTPIPNAEVSLYTIVYLQQQNKDFKAEESFTGPYFTDSSGICEGDIGFPVTAGIIFSAYSFMQINVAGMSTTFIATQGDPFSKFLSVYTSGDTMTLAFPPDTFRGSKSTIFIRKIAGYKDGQTKTFLEASPPGKPFDVNSGAWSFYTLNLDGLRAFNPTAVLITVEITLPKSQYDFPTGRPTVLLAGSLDLASSDKVFSAGLDPQDENPIVTMRRLVVISDTTYIATMQFWREYI